MTHAYIMIPRFPKPHLYRANGRWQVSPFNSRVRSDWQALATGAVMCANGFDMRNVFVQRQLLDAVQLARRP